MQMFPNSEAVLFLQSWIGAQQHNRRHAQQPDRPLLLASHEIRLAVKRSSIRKPGETFRAKDPGNEHETGQQ
jgi:hypothetical protein